MPKKTAMLCALLFSAFVCLGGAAPAQAAGNTTNDSFNKAKRMLERQVYAEHIVTIYCGYRYGADKKVEVPDSFSTPRFLKRAYRVEWEHSVPAENFGRAFAEWRDGDAQCVDRKGKPFKGRSCAEKVNQEYRFMQADMYNLFPAVGAVNAMRSNYNYAMLPDMESTFGSCPMKVDEQNHRAEPPEAARGQLARAALYMDDSYPRYNLSRQQKQLFESWNRMYPVDQWECTRASRIEKLQGNENRFVKDPCEKAGLWK